MSPALQITLTGIGTYVFRASFVVLLARVDHVPERIRDGLRMIPPAILGAIVGQSLVLDDGAFRDLSTWHLAAVVAALVALRTRSVIWCLATGMTTLWTLSALT